MLPPTSTEKSEIICRLSSKVMTPIITMIKASRGPPLPPMAAKAIDMERAHLNAWTAVAPNVSTPPLVLVSAF